MYIGIEFHDLGLRAAILANGHARAVPLDTGLVDHMVDFERSDGKSSLGIAFPSFLREIGGGGTLGSVRGDVTAERYVEEHLQLVRRAIEFASGTEIEGAVIAVPSVLSSSRRSALLASAGAAGLADLQLVDSCLAAAVAYASNLDRPNTQLVFNLGYSECEIALVRIVRGRVKVIELATAPQVSGERLDLAVMEAIVKALQERSIFLGLGSFRARQWLQLRSICAKARALLGQRPEVAVSLASTVAANTGQIRLTLSAAGIAVIAAPLIRTALEEAQALLERHEVGPGEIDAVVALAEATHYPAAQMLALAFPEKVQLADPDPAAAAAAVYAAWLQQEAATDADAHADIKHFLRPYKQPSPGMPPLPAEGNVDPSPLVVAVSLDDGGRAGQPPLPMRPAAAAPAPFAAPPAAAQSAPAAASAAADAATLAAQASSRTKALVDPLIEQGRLEEAAQLLMQIAPTQTATTTAPQAAPVAPQPDPKALQSIASVLMTEAIGQLERGQLESAVALSHKAFDAAPGDVGTLAAMVDVHVGAALALSDPSDYEQAIDFLSCALGHDQLNPKILAALASRHAHHAEAMLKAGDLAAAAAAIAVALESDPTNAIAHAVRSRLNGAGDGMG